MRESLIFHRLVEVDGVRLYSGGISTSLVSTMNKMRGEMVISVAGWNAPVELPVGVVAGLVRTDCYYQSRNSYQHYAVLTSSQVLIQQPHCDKDETFLEKGCRGYTIPRKVSIFQVVILIFRGLKTSL